MNCLKVVGLWLTGDFDNSKVLSNAVPGSVTPAETEASREGPKISQYASWRTMHSWTMTPKSGVIIGLHRDNPGPPCLVNNPNECRKETG